MALTVSFSISQSALTPAAVTATDTSEGSDAAVTQRRIFFQNSQGQYITTSGTSTSSAFESWAYADASETWDLLDEDTAVAITVQWLNVANEVLYTLTQLYCLAEFNKQNFYYLLQQQALSPAIYQDKNYQQNLATYWVNITGAIQAIEIGADLSASQNCLNRATEMLNNQAKYF